MYLDLLIILNTAVNLFLLWLTGFIIQQRATFKRLVAGSLLGGVFILFFLLPSGETIFTWLGKALLPPIMVLVTFRPRLFQQGILLLLLFYFCSFAMGGLVLAFSFWRQSPVDFSGGIYYLPAPSLFCLLLAGITLYTLARWFRPLLLEKLNFHIPALDLKLEIAFCGKSKTLSAFVDTGNMLKEPFSGSPVAVAAYPVVRELLPPEVCSFLSSSKTMDWNLLEKALTGINNAARFCLVPYRSLHGEGFLLGFRPEKVTLWQKGRSFTFIKKIIIGIQREQISPDAEYEVLLPLEVWRCAGREEGLKQ
jgi:stage II sporulation protein GA (sporulation sigma-E factor processing peptidase)